MKKSWLLFVLVLSLSVTAQNTDGKKTNDLRLASIPYYNFGKGIGITSPDSLFQLNLRFRIQNRVTYIDEEGEKGAYDGQIRRLRLRFDGFVGNPKFLYALQLSFAPGDVGEVKEGENLNIIRDAVIFYRPNKHWSFSFGQTKLPGNRQRVNSSGGLQLTDRTINNAKFNIDRDFGFQAHYLHENKERFSYAVRTAISTGEGRNVTGKADDGVALTGKLELYPLGSFTKDGTFFEGDLMRESKPKLLFSGAFQQNNQARRTGGQLGDDLFDPRTMKTLMLDAMFKYNGWAVMGAYFSRTTSKNPITVDPLDASHFRYVFNGSGYDAQASYLFPTHYEIIGRFSSQQVSKSIETLAPDTHEFSLGLTKYIWEHAFKLQGEVNYDRLKYFDGATKGNWYVRFQIEMGI